MKPPRETSIEPPTDPADAHLGNTGELHWLPLSETPHAKRRASFKAALSRVNDWYGKALRKLAE